MKKYQIMSIVNLTDDSFYSHSRNFNINKALKKTEEHIENGADIIDVGACSTRPGSIAVDNSIEQNRIQEYFKKAEKMFPKVVFSVDTYRSNVAKIALDYGAKIINDVSAAAVDKNIVDVAAQYDATYILMHSQTPVHTFCTDEKTDIIDRVNKFFEDNLIVLKEKKVNKIWLDVGFGFGKTLTQNYKLISQMSSFKQFDLPILAGVSRKKMTQIPFEIESENALITTCLANLKALENGASIIRVHDTLEAIWTIKFLKMLP